LKGFSFVFYKGVKQVDVRRPALAVWRKRRARAGNRGSSGSRMVTTSSRGRVGSAVQTLLLLLLPDCLHEYCTAQLCYNTEDMQHMQGINYGHVVVWLAMQALPWRTATAVFTATVLLLMLILVPASVVASPYQERLVLEASQLLYSLGELK
jgi:hypothetical protein